MTEADKNPITTAAETADDDDKALRLKELEAVFLDVSEAAEGQPIGAHSLRAVQHGESIRLILNEILELRELSEAEVQLNELRSAYVETQFIKAGLITRAQRREYDERSDQLQSKYVEAVVGKIERIVDATTPAEALELGQLPPIVRKTSFIDGVTLPMTELAANHLYILMDTALIEHAKRRAIIDEHDTGSLRARITSSRGTRLAIGSVVGLASLAPELSFVPRPEEVITHDIELALRGLSGVIIGVNLPEFIRLKYLGRMHRLQSEENIKKLSDDQQSCELAMNIAYGSGRIGGHQKETRVTGRYVTDDKKENQRRLKAMERNFPHMNNDPGGRPYSARQALSFASRLVIERRQQLAAIIDPSKPAAEQKRLFLELCREMITEDVRRMKKGLNVTKLRRAAWGSLGIVPAILFPAATGATSNAASLSEDTYNLIGHRSSDENDE